MRLLEPFAVDLSTDRLAARSLPGAVAGRDELGAASLMEDWVPWLGAICATFVLAEAGCFTEEVAVNSEDADGSEDERASGDGGAAVV